MTIEDDCFDLLTFKELQEANEKRDREWNPNQQLTLVFRGNELAGEVGEFCNVIKKLERERIGLVGSRSTPQALADEAADVIICVALAVMQANRDLGLNINLGDAVRRKFNKTSEERGLQTKL